LIDTIFPRVLLCRNFNGKGTALALAFRLAVDETFVSVGH